MGFTAANNGSLKLIVCLNFDWLNRKKKKVKSKNKKFDFED